MTRCQAVHTFTKLCVSPGAGDITAPISETRAGKLPQQVISKTAAHGYSSYGNQIGLATTYVREYFHPGFVAKRMELGAVVGAAPKGNVVRENRKRGCHYPSRW